MNFWQKTARVSAWLLFALAALVILYRSYGLLIGGMNRLLGALSVALSVLAPALAGAALYAASLEREADKRRMLRAVLWTLFGFYLLALFSARFFARIDFRGYAAQHDFYRENMELMTNFIPFETILLYIRALRYDYIGTTIPLANLMGNICLFMPMAFFLPCLFPSMRRFWKFLVLMLLLLMAVECLQLILCCGSCDVDDVLLNLTGTLIVYGLMRLPPVRRLLTRLYLLPAADQ
ncbi:MAG: VanZ family protein, partial [Clostridia bacterium]|nr:VanZ family protein [Clostridia bacterium]